MENLEENNGINKFTLWLKGILLSMGLTLIMILFLSVLLSISNIKESVIMPTVIFISTFSILIGAFFISRKIESKGIIYGSLLGLIYMMILYLISSIMSLNFSLGLNSIIMIVFGVIGGAIGGILGVNLK